MFVWGYGDEIVGVVEVDGGKPWEVWALEGDVVCRSGKDGVGECWIKAVLCVRSV